MGRVADWRGCRHNADVLHAPGKNTNSQRDDGKIAHMEITDKERAIEAVRSLPEQATMEDAIERLCFVAKIEAGLRQSEARELVSHDEVKKQFLS